MIQLPHCDRTIAAAAQCQGEGLKGQTTYQSQEHFLHVELIADQDRQGRIRLRASLTRCQVSDRDGWGRT